MKARKEASQKEIKTIGLEDALNTDTWRCAIVMGIEKNWIDTFVIKEFTEEALRGRRREIRIINYEQTLLKILDEFAKGELAFKYLFLLQFEAVFREAAECVNKKAEIPVELLVKVVKAILLLYKTESLRAIEKRNEGPRDRIKVMADRAANLGGTNQKNGKNVAKKERQDGSVKIRPPSVTKEETQLLKRGEKAKDDQCIDDAPYNGYFSMYVMLTGFYDPQFPVELIKMKIPLHGILCINTSFPVPLHNYSKTQRQASQIKGDEIQIFWEKFLSILWNPETCFYFKEIIFQVYSPKMFPCDHKKMGEFIYAELSYLMYDLSDYKRQHINYLNNLKIREVEAEMTLEANEKCSFELDDLPNECLTVPVVLQCLLDTICGEDGLNYRSRSDSYTSTDSTASKYFMANENESASVLSNHGTSYWAPLWYQMLLEAGNEKSLKVYGKVKELDLKYKLYEESDSSFYSKQSSSEASRSQVSCRIKKNRIPAENMEEALNREGGIFIRYWKKYKNYRNLLDVAIDYCLYAYMISKVACSKKPAEPSAILTIDEINKTPSLKRMSTYELIENIEDEMRKPHFTVTESSKSVIRCIPHNMKERNRNVFCPSNYKVVTPEKVKISSAPEFPVGPYLINEMSFISDLIVPDSLLSAIDWNVFENLRNFIGDNIFSGLNGFEFIEELSKSQLTKKEAEHWANYNCIDHRYSALTDTIFLVLHNRKDDDNCYHESFNTMLTTRVGFRDFFEYILDEKIEWFEKQEEIYKKSILVQARSDLQSATLDNYKDSDFWMENSIKYNEAKSGNSPAKQSFEFRKGEAKEEVRKSYAENREDSVKVSESLGSRSELFEGYEVDDMAVQYSGLKAVYYGVDSSMTVELVERLYGEQTLGVHMNQGGHTLYLYSYVCPKPHIVDPYTCHLVVKNGIVLAFGKRFVETIAEIEVEEVVESKTTTNKPKRAHSDNPVKRIIKQRVSKIVEDEEFVYDLKLSLPNSLMVEVVRGVAAVKPCYLKQHFINTKDANAYAEGEACRLFLPNGNLIKKMKDGSFRVLKGDTSTVTALLDDLAVETAASDSEERAESSNEKRNRVVLAKYETVTSNGCSMEVVCGQVTSSRRLAIFENTDIETNRMYYRRRDGTDYMVSSSGSLCVQFKDGTRISSTPLETCLERKSSTSENENQTEEDSLESDFVIVNLETIVEHPSYATTIYNTETEQWTILLPEELLITVNNDGNYFVRIDKQTTLEVAKDTIQMNRHCPEGELVCSFKADLDVFRNDDSDRYYCTMENSTGDRYVVEASSNSFQSTVECSSGSDNWICASNLSTKQRPAESPPNEVESRTTLSENNKYFVVRKDITGFEVLHRDVVQRRLTDIEKGSVVYTMPLPCVEKLRCFVLISPLVETSKLGPWHVDSVLPDPKFRPNPEPKKTSSTYGDPPSWMHPFPKKKSKFEIPHSLSCRVFIETVPSGFSPGLGNLDCNFCELEVAEGEGPKWFTEPGVKKVQEQVRKLTENDQETLKKMYLHSANLIINRKKCLKPVNSERLEHYLAMSRYYVELQEYHKCSIRYHCIPNYFQYPLGMMWLLLNDLIDGLKFESSERQQPMATPQISLPAVESSSEFSNEEIEYDLPWSSTRSFSDLSLKTNISSKTGPAVLNRQFACTCKVMPSRNAKSAPICNLRTQIRSADSLEFSQQGFCSFKDNELEALKRTKGPKSKTTASVLLDDLIILGFI